MPSQITPCSICGATDHQSAGHLAARKNTPWCPYCMKDVQENDTDHAVDDDGELTDCNVYGRTVG